MGNTCIHVSDTTAITNLAAIGRLDLLEALFGELCIPQAVFDELTMHGDHVPGAREVHSSSWIKVRAVRNQDLVRRLRSSIDLGEAEAITLTLECNARTLVIDECAGRQIALSLGVPIIGVLGILIEAKRRGLIDSAGRILARLRSEAGFRVGRAMVARVLREAGEQ